MSHTNPSWDTLHPPSPGAGGAAGAHGASLDTGKGSCDRETRSLAATSEQWGLQKTSYCSLPWGGVRHNDGVPVACGTQEHRDLSSLEVTDVREEARSARGLVRSPAGSQSMCIPC